MSMVMPVTVEERDADQSRRGQKENFSETNMYFYGREICFILAILITTYAALQNAPPKISKSPSPVPFFPRTSLVADFYHGQLVPAFERVIESDVSFVMYYAPWDAESQATRLQFKLVAQYYYKQVYFAAINCWQPHSECRQKFSKVQQFPVLIVHTQHNKGIQYKGIREASHMIRFLQHVLHPLTRITSQSDLVELMTMHDAVVVGFFTFAGNIGAPGYHTFYETALRFLERDPHREVGFAVVTDARAIDQMMVEQTPTLRIYMWNETLEYSHHEEFYSEALVKWISSSTHQVSVWLSPPGIKSLTLAPYVEDGSVLIMFTPRNPLRDHNYNYNLLREVGLEYYNCDGNPWVTRLASHFARERIEAKENTLKMEAECHMWRDHSMPSVQVVGKHWTNGSCRSTCGSKCHLKFGPMHHDDYVCCKKEASHEISILTGSGDERSASALKEAAILERCRRLRRAKLVHSEVIPHSAYHRKSPRHFMGLACRTNRTVSLIAMDSLQYHQFAEGLGINILQRPEKTAVIIFNVLEESSYILQAELSKGAILEFIYNYTEGTLNRSLRSSSVQYPGSLNQYPQQSEDNCSADEEVCVRELHSRNFYSVVMDPNTAVVVLYHSPFCTFCHGISHIYLTVARYFRAVQNLTFVRIDGENNDLPWEYTMPHYPTILFFPAVRKSESRVYPRNRPVTVPNLVNFVLANLDPEEGILRGMMGLCAGWAEVQDEEEARECIVRVRRESLAAIDSTLKQYRALKTRWHHNHRQVRNSLYRLQYLKEVHLLLGSLERLSLNSREYKNIQQLYERYQNIINFYIEPSRNLTSTDKIIKDEL